jgi:predicted nucleotide-binding protein
MGVRLLQARVDDLENLDIDLISGGDDPRLQELSARILSTLSQIYGVDSVEYARLSEAAKLYLSNRVLTLGGGGPGGIDTRNGLARGRSRAISLLRGELGSLREVLAHDPSAGTAAPPKPREYSTEVFVVHGHDDLAKAEVARLIERAGLNAIILHEQASSSRTIIEKFEDHGGSAGFAVVLLTPDDVGGPDPDHLQHRARQNVIGEMFWFAAKLGRRRVCALRKSGVEVPSDFDGVVYIEMDDRGAWKAKLLKELVAAGYTVDWAKAMA